MKVLVAVTLAVAALLLARHARSESDFRISRDRMFADVNAALVGR